MNSFLTIASKFLAYSDGTATESPQQKAFDWGLNIRNVRVSDPKTFPGSIPAGASVTIFDGTRTTSLDNTSAFTVSLSPLDSPSRYRFTWVSGTDPGLRVDRGLTLTGQTITVSLNADFTANFSIGGGTFGSTAAGDTIFIPSVSTGDAQSVFNEDNTGFWTVLAVISSTNIQVTRPTGTSYTAAGEAVALTSNSDIQAFTADGVQPGDNVTISAGFSVGTRRTYEIDKVTSSWFEVLTGTPIALEASKTPTATGMVFYTDARQWVHVQVDQESVARFDGDTGDTNRLSPFQDGDLSQGGWSQKAGSCHKLVLVNKSISTLNYICLSTR